jgi:hypothetical protein
MQTVMRRGTRHPRFALGLAVVNWSALLIQLYLIVRPATDGAAFVAAILRNYTFFTNQNKIFVALVATSAALDGRRDGARFFSQPGVMTCAAASIALVGIAYSVLLRHLYSFTGLQLLVDHLLHDAVPPLFVLYWWLTLRGERIPAGDALRGAWYPCGYFVFMLGSGLVTGWYPYPFVDVNAIGYGRTLINALAILALYFAIALALAGLAHLTSRDPDRQRRAEPV